MSERLTIGIDALLAGKLRLGWLLMDRVDPSRRLASFEADLAALCVRLREEYDSPAAAGQRHQPARALYRSVGIDPTKYRPSSEALLRRVLTGKPLYRVNAVVDAANLCSLEAALPVGLYDLQQIRGQVTADSGRSGDGYEGIGKGRVNLEGKILLRDEEGPFGNPSADSFRTRVREETRGILFVYFAPLSVEPPELGRLISGASARLAEYAGGIEKGRGMAPENGAHFTSHAPTS